MLSKEWLRDTVKIVLPAVWDIYLAAPLFTEAERAYNKRLKRKLETAGWKVYLPQDEAGKYYPDVDRVAQECIKGLMESRCVVAVLDGSDVDSGVGVELGIACTKYYSSGFPQVVIETPIIGIRTDLRAGGDGKRYAVNLMIEAIVSEIVSDECALVAAIKEKLEE